MEKVFFEYDDVKVTSTRFINGANTYAMAGITSVQLRHVDPDYTDVYIMLFLGILCLMASYLGFQDDDPGMLSGGLMGAIFFAVVAFFSSKKKNTTYFIMLSTSAGQTEGLITYQLEYVNQVSKALNDAIIYRE
jgi:hypothetical protein